MKKFGIIYNNDLLDIIITAVNEDEAYEKACEAMGGWYDPDELFIEELDEDDLKEFEKFSV